MVTSAPDPLALTLPTAIVCCLEEELTASPVLQWRALGRTLRAQIAAGHVTVLLLSQQDHADVMVCLMDLLEDCDAGLAKDVEFSAEELRTAYLSNLYAL